MSMSCAKSPCDQTPADGVPGTRRLLWVAAVWLVALSASPTLVQAQEGRYLAETLAIVSACAGVVDPMLDTATDFGVAIAGSGGSASCGVSASSSGTAQAGFNFVATSAGASSSGASGAVGTSRGESHSSFVVDAPGLTGTLGTMVFGFSVNGSIGAVAFDGGSFSSASYDLVLDSSVDHFVLGESTSRFDDTAPDGELTLGSHAHLMGIRFGDPITFDLAAGVHASAGSVPGGNASAVAAFGHTFAWNGIVDVLDAQGVSVAGYSAIDSLGRNWSLAYAAPVPEPASVWSMMAGLACLGSLIGLRRRRAGTGLTLPAPRAGDICAWHRTDSVDTATTDPATGRPRPVGHPPGCALDAIPMAGSGRRSAAIPARLT